MNTAVTGGTGFIGGPLVRMLVDRFDAVRVLVRRPQDDDRIRSMGAEPVRGDLTVRGGCDELVQPGDVVVHAAARVDLVGRWPAFRHTTVEGTRELLGSALPRNPARFVYVSSAGVYAPESLATVPRADPPSYNLYGRAKRQAEDLVRSKCERAGCPWSIVRLGFCYGPGNRALLRHLVPRLERGRLPIIGDGQNRIATCYVDDAARAIVLAATVPAAVGRIYDVASDETVTQRQFYDATADALNLPRTRRRVRRRLAYALAFVADMAGKVFRFDPPLTRSMVILMGVDQVLNADPIRNELGWRAEVDFEEGMRRVAEEHGAG